MLRFFFDQEGSRATITFLQLIDLAVENANECQSFGERHKCFYNIPL